MHLFTNLVSLQAITLAFAQSHRGIDWSSNVFPTEENTSGLQQPYPFAQRARVNFKTSLRQFASSVGSVFITFLGDRATSDTTLLQTGFIEGATDSKLVDISRDIGKLQKVKLQTNSSDGWLLASIWIGIGTTSYFFEPPSIFLDYPNSDLADRYWTGGADGSSFSAPPVGTLDMLFEPQSSTLNPEEGSMEGLLGVQSVLLSVVDSFDILETN
jgi:hypothetical protein